jgi:hypothetical protein
MEDKGHSSRCIELIHGASDLRGVPVECAFLEKTRKCTPKFLIQSANTGEV